MKHTSECVSLGHPDKVADHITSYLLDRYLERDPQTRYAIEVQIKDNFVTLGGEVTSSCAMTDEEIVGHVKDAIREIGYTEAYAAKWGRENCIDPSLVEVTIHIGKQSPDIAQGVDADGWGDQGIFWGMATGGSDTGYMPKDHYLARELCRVLYDLAKSGGIEIGLDIKTQVAMDGDKVEQIVVAAPMAGDADKIDWIKKSVAGVAVDVCNAKKDTEIIVNGTGAYVRHASQGDCGTTGRKLAVDFYGGNCRIGGGCVDGETEYLAPDGWHRIKDYHGGKVGQIDDDFNLSFVVPRDYIQTYHDEVYEISASKTVSMVLSGNHNVYYKTSKGNFIKKSAHDLVEQSEKASRGHHAEIPRFFLYDFSEGIKRPNAALNRLVVAHCADGTVIHGGTQTAKWNGRIRVKKEYKKTAMREILGTAGVEYEERDYHDGYATFVYHLKNTSKLLSEQFVNPDRETAELLASEVKKWDGSEKDQVYRTTKKADADFMQFVLSGVTGDSYTIYKHKIHGRMKNVCYSVHRIEVKYSSPFRKGHGATVRKVQPMKMYCFTVDTGLLLLRRKDCIFVTGNSPWSKDPSKADVSLNIYAREKAVEMLHKACANTVYCAISCCIGRSDIRIAYFDEHMNSLGSSVEYRPASEIIKELGLRAAVFAWKNAHGLFTMPPTKAA